MSNYERDEQNSREASEQVRRSPSRRGAEPARQAESDKTGNAQANDEPGSAPESGDKEP